MPALPWIAIFFAASAASLSSCRWLVLGLLALGYGAALSNGQLDLQSTYPVALLFIAAFGVSRNRKTYVQYVAHALFIVLAIALLMHRVPGFHNPRVFGPARITPDAVPFTMYLNFDKPMIGFWVLLVLPWARRHREGRATVASGIAGALITALACLLPAVLLGVVKWAPKWPPVSWLWMLNNLLLVTLAEEALFRGYVQGGLSRMLKKWTFGDVFSLGAATALFGLSHLSSGWQWVLLGSIAGIGYGMTYRFYGLQAAILAHFGLNVIQFFLFTYPMLQPGFQS